MAENLKLRYLYNKYAKIYENQEVLALVTDNVDADDINEASRINESDIKNSLIISAACRPETLDGNQAYRVRFKESAAGVAFGWGGRDMTQDMYSDHSRLADASDGHSEVDYSFDGYSTTTLGNTLNKFLPTIFAQMEGSETQLNLLKEYASRSEFLYNPLSQPVYNKIRKIVTYQGADQNGIQKWGWEEITDSPNWTLSEARRNLGLSETPRMFISEYITPTLVYDSGLFDVDNSEDVVKSDQSAPAAQKALTLRVSNLGKVRKSRTFSNTAEFKDWLKYVRGSFHRNDAIGWCNYYLPLSMYLNQVSYVQTNESASSSNQDVNLRDLFWNDGDIIRMYALADSGKRLIGVKLGLDTSKISGTGLKIEKTSNSSRISASGNTQKLSVDTVWLQTQFKNFVNNWWTSKESELLDTLTSKLGNTKEYTYRKSYFASKCSDGTSSSAYSWLQLSKKDVQKWAMYHYLVVPTTERKLYNLNLGTSVLSGMGLENVNLSGSSQASVTLAGDAFFSGTPAYSQEQATTYVGLQLGTNGQWAASDDSKVVIKARAITDSEIQNYSGAYLNLDNGTPVLSSLDADQTAFAHTKLQDFKLGQKIKVPVLSCLVIEGPEKVYANESYFIDLHAVTYGFDYYRTSRIKLDNIQWTSNQESKVALKQSALGWCGTETIYKEENYGFDPDSGQSISQPVVILPDGLEAESNAEGQDSEISVQMLDSLGITVDTGVTEDGRLRIVLYRNSLKYPVIKKETDAAGGVSYSSYDKYSPSSEFMYVDAHIFKENGAKNEYKNAVTGFSVHAMQLSPSGKYPIDFAGSLSAILKFKDSSGLNLKTLTNSKTLLASVTGLTDVEINGILGWS